MIDKKHKGTLAELMACKALLSQDLEIFRNISPHGLCDIVSFNPNSGKLTPYDVKTVHYYINKNKEKTYYQPKLSDAQVKAGVKLLVVYPEEGLVTHGELN